MVIRILRNTTHEFLIKKVDSYGYDPTLEIRFNGADIMAIYKLAI